MHHAAKLQDTSLFILRLVTAAIFLSAGIAKWSMWAAPLEGMSPMMWNLTRLLAVVEPLGGLALIAGFLTRWAALGLAIIMAGSLYFVRVLMNAAFFTGLQGIGMDYNVLILASCIVLLAFGPGKWSVEAVMKK